MTAELEERQMTLRMVRFFLPRLERQELANEIEDEKARLRQESDTRINGIRSDADAAVERTAREREEHADRSSRRISDMRRDAEDRIRQETSQIRSQLKGHDERKARDVMIIVGACLALIIGIALAAGLGSGAPVLISLAGLVGVAWGGTDCWRAVRQANSCRQDIDARETAIRGDMQRKVTEEENAGAAEAVLRDCN